MGWPSVAASTVDDRCNAEFGSDKPSSRSLLVRPRVEVDPTTGSTCYGRCMQGISDTTSFKEKLDAMHTFPGPFMFKVIGENTEAFQENAVKAVKAVAPDADPSVTRRESKGARHQSLTLVVHVESSQAVIDIYDRFSQLDGIKFMF